MMQQQSNQNALARNLGIDGTRKKGDDVRGENVQAILTVANMVKSSLGPQGLDKLIVDKQGNVTVTNDGATILKKLRVEHPASKLLVDLANSQDEAVGDGTTSVVILAGELLKNATEMIKNKIHPTNIIAGYRQACQKAIEYVRNELALDTNNLGKDTLIQVAKTSMSSKILGSYSDFFGQMVVDAVQRIKVEKEDGKAVYPINAINILKQHGGGLKESVLVNGFALNCVKSSQQMPSVVKGAKIAFLDFDLRKSKLKMGIAVEITDVSKLEAIREKENTLIRDRIQLILNAGANVIFTTMGIDDLCNKYLIEAGVMGVRRCEKKDLRRLARLTGGQLLGSLVDLEGTEGFNPTDLGQADEVSQERLADDELIYIKGCKNKTAASIVLRGANEFMLDEMDRTLHDAICVIKRVLESQRVVVGGGAVEAALSIYLEKYATTIETREQTAISEYARSLLAIPKILASNAACDATELVAKLRAYHNEAQNDTNDGNRAKRQQLKHYGLDLIEGTITDNVKRGVLEPALTKIKYLEYSLESAVTILRIDDCFTQEESIGDQ